MTENGPRRGEARDVPPPRPVTPQPAIPDESGLGRAARAVADAVAGLVGGAGGRPADQDAGQNADQGAGRWGAAAGGLRDVVGAVAGAVGAAFAPDHGTGPARDGSAASSSGAPGADRSPGALLGDLLSAVAPRLPIRDAARLRAAHPGASDREIEDALVARAARMTSAVGAATGGLSAAHWLAPPSLLALPLELGAETVLVAGVEIVLIGELHELHGRRPPGDARARAAAYLAGWSAQRSVDGAGVTGLGSILTAAGMRTLQRRVTRRLAGSVPKAAPMLIGAAIAGRTNRRGTEKLAENVLADLRDTPPLGPPS